MGLRTLPLAQIWRCADSGYQAGKAASLPLAERVRMAGCKSAGRKEGGRMSVKQKSMYELFMETVPKEVVAIARAQALRKLFDKGLVEFFIGEDQQVRVRLLEYSDNPVARMAGCKSANQKGGRRG
jgi:hypothetical protein